MNDETKLLIAKFYLDENKPRDYSDWAVSCLEKGLDTKHLRILASLFNADSFSDIEVDFRESLKELGWEFPNKEDSLLLNYLQLLAKQIIEGMIEPIRGCRQIYLLSYELNNWDLLRNWMWLDEGRHPETLEFLWDQYEEEKPTKAIIDAIICEANMLLKDDYFLNLPKPKIIEYSSNPVKTETFFRKLLNRFFL